MVTPAAKREAVAHLVETYEMSERRACRLIRPIERPFATVPADRATRIFGVACESWRASNAGLAIAACMSCCAPRAMR